jgi:hypothetical protein
MAAKEEQGKMGASIRPGALAEQGSAKKSVVTFPLISMIVILRPFSNFFHSTAFGSRFPYGR